MVGDGVNDAPGAGPGRRRHRHRRRHRRRDRVRRRRARLRRPARRGRRRSGCRAASYRKMVQNLAWAAGYNLVAIPLAAGVLAWAGVTLPPAVGAVLMSVSTIVVALNAQLLRRLDLRRTDRSEGARMGCSNSGAHSSVGQSACLTSKMPGVRVPSAPTATQPVCAHVRPPTTGGLLVGASRTVARRLRRAFRRRAGSPVGARRRATQASSERRGGSRRHRFGERTC